MKNKNAVRARDLVTQDSLPVVVATHRKFAALVAFSFPIAVIGIVIIAISKVGMVEVLNHTTMRALFFPGIVALGIWITRYWRSALVAFTLMGNPIEITGDEVSFFGNILPLSRNPVFHTDTSNVYVTTDGGMEFSARNFFVKSNELNINMSPLTP